MREACRTCGNKRKEGVKWFDDDYCSGKCRKLDGESMPPVAEQIKSSGVKASLAEYLLDYPKKLGEKDKRGQRIKGREPKRYRLRCDPEKLNWDEPMSAMELEQAGFRCNRKAIPGDWDFEKEEEAIARPNEWQLLKAKAKSLGIATHAKDREQIEVEIQEIENG